MNDFSRISTGQPNIASQPRQRRVAEAEAVNRRTTRRSPKARINVIPDMEQLRKLVDDALSALSRGVYWDRGSIVDIIL